ncbi:MAG: hypothetical protein HKN94_14065 [Acidimicrobiales bacterium]|nr:hypothetical protein [Acidimicrobiales bacterium]
MKWNHLRLLGALFAVILIAASCGSSTTETADAADDTMDQMDDDGHGDHDDTDHGDDHDNMDHGDDGGHSHAGLRDVDQSNPIPAVDIAVSESGSAGTYDVAVTLENFTIDEASVDGEAVPGTGHMHMLIDGVKLGRFFDLDYPVELTPGEHVVEVELNGNDHTPWAVDGTRINATQRVNVPGEPPVADVLIEAALAGDSVTIDDDRVDVDLGSTVELVVSADLVERVHVHGYDIIGNVSPDFDTRIPFVADTAGKFEVEFEGSGVFIVELVVS